MVGDVLLGCLQAKGYATQLQPMHALIPSIFKEMEVSTKGFLSV